MLEKLCDARNAFEGKALAVFMSLVLAFSFTSWSSLANAVEDGSSSDASETLAGEQPDGAGDEATGSVQQDGSPVSAPSDASDAPGAPGASGASETPQQNNMPSADLPTAEPGVAVVGVELDHAYLVVAEQEIALPLTSFKTPFDKDLAFQAKPDSGYEIDSVVVKNKADGTEEAVEPQADGSYVLAASEVSSNLVIKPTTKPAAEEGAVGDAENTLANVGGNGQADESAPSSENSASGANANAAMPFGASSVFEAAAVNIPTELAVEPASLELNAGTSGKLKAVVEPAGSDGNVVWTSSNENVAKVLEDGTVKALSGGTVTITARSVANPALANVSVVTVVDARTVTFWTGTGEGEITSLATPTTAGSTILMPELPDGAVNNWPKDRVFVGWSVDKDAVASGGKDHYTKPVFAPGSSYTVPSGSGNVKLFAIYSAQNIGAQFYLRIDGQFPAEPQGHNNSGYVSVGWVNNAIKIGKFVTDTTGAAVSANLSATPSDDVVKQACANSQKLSFDPETQTVVWYVIKNEGTWHVDGAIRNKASVVLAYNPNIPAGETLKGDFPNTKAYSAGATVTVENGKADWRAGYAFKEWNTASDGSGTSYQGGYSITLNESKTLYAIWTPKDGTNYRVQDYLQNPDGSWPDEPSYSTSASGKTGATVHADTTKSYTGYTFDADNDKNVLTGSVAGDGSLVLKRYYAINTCKVTYLPGDHGAFEPAAYEALFGTETPKFQGQTDDNGKPKGESGYNFAGWAPDVSPTVQAETTEYVAQWTKKPVINVLVKSEDKTVVYDGTEHVVSVASENLVYEGLPEGYRIQNLSASGRGTEAGVYDIAIDGTPVVLDDKGVDVTDQFVIARDKNKLTVEQAPLTITAPTKEKVYDGAPLTFDLGDIVRGSGLVEGLVDGHHLAGIDVFGSITDVGTADSSVLQAVVTSGTENVTRNYRIVYKPGTLTVKEFAGTIEATTVGGEYTYDGEAHGATVNVSELPAGYTLVTASSNASATDVTDEPVVATVDTLRIINEAGVDVTSRLHIVKNEEGRIVVKPATVKVETPSASRVYNGEPLTAAGKMTGLVNNETAAFATTGTATEVNAPDGTPNTYRIDWTGTAKQSNYTVVESIGTLTVTEYAGSVVVTTVGGEFLYNGDLHGATVKVEGLPAGYWIDAAASNASAVDVTEEPVPATVDNLVIRNASGVDVTDRLNIQKVDGQIVVKPAPMTVRVVGNSALETYSGSAFAVDGFTIETDLAGKATVELKDGAAAHAEGVDAGTYPMGLTADSFDVASRNYEVTLEVVDGFLKIAPLDTLEVGAESIVKRYDGNSYGIEAVSSVDDGRTVIKYFNESTGAFDLDSSPVFKDAGTHVVRFQATHPNYSNVAEGSATVTIDKRAVILESASDSRQYNGEALVAPTVSVSGDGFVAGEEPAFDGFGSATNVADTREGNNEFSYAFGEGVNADNYQVTTVFGTLTITPAPLTVTVTGNHASASYDGSLHEVDGFIDDAAGKATVTLKDGAAAHAEGVDAGTYPMGLTADSFDVVAPNHVVALVVVDGYLTIDPAGTMSVSADDVTKTYDGNRYGVQAQASVEGATVLYRDPATGEYTLEDSPTFLDATDGAQIVEFQATHPNYDTVYGSATVTIDKRPVVLRSADAAQEYNGTALVKHEASVEGSFVSGQEPALEYRGSATNVADTREGNNEFSYAFGEGVNADNYQVTTVFGTLTITPAPLTVTVTGAFDNVMFDGQSHVVDGYTVGDEAAGKATVELALNERAHAEGVDAGRYPMGLTADRFTVQSDNYRVTLNVIDGYLNIDPAGTMSVAAQPVVKTYDGFGYGVEAKASIDGAQVKYYNKETGAYDLDASPKFSDVGTYTVMFQAVRDNYETAKGEATVTINPRTITLTSANGFKQYDGSALSAESVDDGGGFVEGEGATFFDFASLTDAGTAPNSFSYRLNEGTKASNYHVNVVPGKLEVEKAPLAVRIQGAANSAEYNGALHAADGFSVLDDIAGKATIELADGVAAHAEGIDAGTYPMGLAVDSFKVESRNYDVTLSVADGSLYVGPATLLIAANDASKAYGQADPELTASVTGLVEGDDFLGSYQVTRAEGNAVGSYPITVEHAVSNDPNYVVEVAPGTFTIVAADAVSIVVAGGTKIYDGTPLVPTGFTPSGLAEGDYVDAVYSGSQTNAGSSAASLESYVIRNAAGEDVTANYGAVTVMPGTLTVNPAAVTITVDDASKIAGTNDPAFTGTPVGLVAEGDLGDISYVRSGDEEGVGVYVDVLTALYEPNANYEVTVLPGTFTITAAPVAPAVPPTDTPAPAGTTPGAVPPDSPLAPVVTPIVDALAGAAEAVIGDNGTPLAQGETNISDNGTPLAGGDRVSCWVHLYIILGIIVTVVYGVCVATRRSLFSRKLKKYENDLTGGGDPAPGSSSGRENGAATGIPKRVPANAVMAAGSGE